MIALRDVSLSRGGKLLFRNLSLTVPTGGKAVIHGPSGCGKTSLLGAIAGLFPVDAGEIEVDGMMLSDNTAAELRARTAFIPQEPVMGAPTVREALLLPCQFKAHRHLSPAKEALEELLRQLGFAETILERDTLTLSGGEKQRIAIARALLLKKTLFLADEITSALDADSGSLVKHLFDRREFTILAISHDPAFTLLGASHYRVENHTLTEVRLS